MDEEENFKEIKRIIRERPAYSRLDKPDTMPVVFKIQRRETLISNWLEYLINHNTETLRSLLKARVGLTDLDKEEVDSYDFDMLKVYREYPISEFGNEKDGFLDFLIEFKNRGKNVRLIIENKIDAPFQDKQLERYSEYMEKHYQNDIVMKILLKRDSYNDKGYAATNGFEIVNYGEFAENLKNIELDFISDLRGSFYMSDFIGHIEDNFVTESVEWDRDWGDFMHQEASVLSELRTQLVDQQDKFLNSLHETVKKYMADILGISAEGIIEEYWGDDNEFHVLRKNEWKSKDGYFFFYVVRREPEKYFVPENLSVGIYFKSETEKITTESFLIRDSDKIMSTGKKHEYKIESNELYNVNYDKDAENPFAELETGLAKFISYYAPQIEENIKKL
ncbi:PD-(D/E)XK nuclease family protein [Weissella cibaria]|uniref:PD-(D/E)XK nuclease family protein n=1 Tax=Weissella cibaria TaxID=137591 RepID=UPI001C1FA9CD|nr:PD-(D/E)XK nuclease family protein [Weissella cibaria]MBU7562094.1 PD-(D/E)XK nuclease family protein [Weissella cibaria]